jgi:hypothetical protein
VCRRGPWFIPLARGLCYEIYKSNSCSHGQPRMTRAETSMFAVPAAAGAVQTSKLRQPVSEGGKICENAPDDVCALGGL